VQFFQFRDNHIGNLAYEDKVQENKRIGLKTEFAFVILSLTAKSVLGWIVAGNLLFVDVDWDI
jgi:hypothetical protein